MDPLKIFIYILVSLYALLTLVAAIADIKERKKFHYWHIFYFIGAIFMLFSLFYAPSKNYLSISLGFMVLVAIFTGYVADMLNIKHIAIRIAISMLLCWLWYM